MYTDSELLALSGLQHIAYYERQWALIHIEQIWSDSGDTAHGNAFHARVDITGYSVIHGVRAERSPRLVSYQLGITGVADIVEYRIGDRVSVMPVEYKVGKPKVEDWDRLQVAAQALCLEEMEGVTVLQGALFYGETRHRETIAIDKALRARVMVLSGRMHELIALGTTPQAVASSKCRRCSLKDDCLPHAAENSASAYWHNVGGVKDWA